MCNRGYDYIRRKAIARTHPGALYSEGVVLGYSDSPMVLIRRPDGSQFWWDVSMCEFGEQTEEIPLTTEESQSMPKPYVREDRATLHTWIVFPSEQLRRAYVLSSAAIMDLTKTDAGRVRRLRLLIQALGGDETEMEPNDG